MATKRMSPRRDAEAPPSARSTLHAPFRIITWTERDIVHVCPFGDVDIDTVGQIRQQIERAAATEAARVVLDLRGVTFLDSTGLHLVLEVDAASRAYGWEFGLIGGPAHVQRVFDLTGSRASLPFLTASQLAALLTAPADAPKIARADDHARPAERESLQGLDARR